MSVTDENVRAALNGVTEALIKFHTEPSAESLQAYLKTLDTALLRIAELPAQAPEVDKA